MYYKTQPQLLQFSDEWFEAVFQSLDRLHDVASAGRLDKDSPVTPADMMGWLEDIVYTAQQTIAEIEANNHPVTTAEKLFS